MKTLKINILHRLIYWLNIKLNLSIKKKIKNKNNINYNSWFTGFIDANEHFVIKINIVFKYKKIKCKFKLSQRKNNYNNKNNYKLLSLDANLLFTTIKEIKKDKSTSKYRVINRNLKENLILEDYLENYFLFLSKYLNDKD